MEAMLSVWFLLADSGFVGGVLTMSIGMLSAWFFFLKPERKVKVEAGTQTEIINMPVSRGPEKILTTRTGECFHAEHCGHVRRTVTRTFRRCRDCLG